MMLKYHHHPLWNGGQNDSWNPRVMFCIPWIVIYLCINIHDKSARRESRDNKANYLERRRHQRTRLHDVEWQFKEFIEEFKIV